MKAIRKAPLASAVALALVAGATHASTIPSMDIPQLYANASIVVHAEVIEQSSQWEDVDGNSLIFTYSTVRVNSTAKRRAASPLMIVRTVGGTVDGISQTLIGEASVTTGEEVVLFMEDVPGWTSQGVVGFHNGKFNVERDAMGTVTRLSRDLGQRPSALPKPGTSVDLSSFVDTIQAVEAGEIQPAQHVHSPTCGCKVIHPLTPVAPAREHQVEVQQFRARPAVQAPLALTFPAPTCPDVNADGLVDVMDLADVVSVWGGQSATADLDGNGIVEIQDVAALVDGWGPCR